MPDTYESAHPCLAPLIDDAALDPDGDGFTNLVEFFVGTDPCDPCPDDPTDDANPADFNKDGLFTGFDLDTIASVIGQTAPPAPVRRDIAPHPPDGQITGADLDAVAARIGQSCAP